MAVEVQVPVGDFNHRYFTIAEYRLMGEAGVFAPDERVELFEGEIVSMSPTGDPHAGCVNWLNMTIVRQLGDSIVCAVQNPIFVGTNSDLLPDLAILAPRPDSYRKGRPTAANILLLIEVSETTQRYDRTRKGPLYARSGVPEYWLVDLAAQVIEVYTQPGPKGHAVVRKAARGEAVQSSSLPALELRVDDVLGDPAPDRELLQTQSSYDQ